MKTNLKEISKYVEGKVAIFIDAANILYSQQTLRWKVDYKKMRNYLKSQMNISGMFYYTGKVGLLENQRPSEDGL